MAPLTSNSPPMNDQEEQQMKLRTKDIMPNTGNKCIDLYELSKNLQKIKKPSDKNTIDYEFEKNRDQCTFMPIINS